MPEPTQPYPASTPTPALLPTVASPLAWTYPFKDKDDREITNPQDFYQALSFMDDGFFPLGVNGFPHGGVHFGNATAARLDQTGGVRCIADGEIVAYRVDDAYPHLQFSDGKWAAYSTGFVLVRHRLTMPRAPTTTEPQSADETHVIYSLYMHVADWNTYLANAKLPRPFWWDVKAFSVVGKDRQSPAADNGSDGIAGAFVWTEPKAGKKKGKYTAGDHVGFLPTGSEVTIGEQRGEWVHIQTITAGAMCSATSGGYFGWEDKNVPWVMPDGIDFDPANHSATKSPVTPEGDWGWLYLPGPQPANEPKRVGEVVIPSPPIQIKAGTLLGQFGEYQDYERATQLPPTPRRSMLHLEVFADNGFSDFLARSRARATQLPADQKTLLVIGTGAKLVQSVAPADRKLGGHDPLSVVKPTDDSPATGPWVKVQPRYRAQEVVHMPYGPPVWIERDKLTHATNNTPAWSRFPLRLQNVADPANGFPVIYSRAQLDALDAQSKAVDDQKANWWRVNFCTPDGKNTRGWVCGKDHPGTRWESPWAWPGFEIVDATGINLADAFKRSLVVTDAADWKEKKEFEPSASTVNNSPLLFKLEQTVAKAEPAKQSGKPGNEQNSKVTATAMQAAMGVPALAQALSHVILRYESEWAGDMSRWNAITPLMRNAKANWLKELERIRKLQWWNDVKGKVAGFPASATVLHIHPIALIANFASACPKACKIEVIEFQTSEGTFRVSKEAFEFILSSEGYIDHPYVPPGDQTSGVTIGYGYDLGQQPQTTIATDLTGIFSPVQITRLQGASGRHGDSARQLQSSLVDIRVSKDMASQLAIVMKRRFAQYTVDAFPGATKLHPHCQGAVLSLVINRGPGMVDKPHQKTRAHMRAIRGDIVSDNLADVPVQWRAMKSLWIGTGQNGLVTRRENEASLFEKGMNCNCWK